MCCGQLFLFQLPLQLNGFLGAAHNCLLEFILITHSVLGEPLDFPQNHLFKEIHPDVMGRCTSPPAAIVVGAVALLLLSGCGAVSAEKTYRQITMEEAITMMEEETGYTILDVRTAQEYGEKHIPGAINIANESIGTEDISELPDKDQLILVYCRSGNRSKQASEKLEKLGYTNIVEIGGINSWPGETVAGDQ